MPASGGQDGPDGVSREGEPGEDTRDCDYAGHERTTLGIDSLSNMRQTLAVCWVLASLVVSLVEGDCTLAETRVMQAKFSNCSRMVTQNTEDICQLLENVVVECGKNWLSCYSEREVRKMRDLHIVHLIRSYEENNNLDDCLVVKEYRWASLGILQIILLAREILFFLPSDENCGIQVAVKILTSLFQRVRTGRGGGG